MTEDVATASRPCGPDVEPVIGSFPVTGPQRSSLETLVRGTGQDVVRGLTRAERIREAGIVDQQGVVAEKIGRSDDD